MEIVSLGAYAQKADCHLDAFAGCIPKILVIGSGGAGNNTINRLMMTGIAGAQTIAVNTDKQHLDMISADTRVLIGKQLTYGMGSGGDPEMGRRCGELCLDTLEGIVQGTNIIFLTAGMGGGTGTGTLPVIARLAKEQGSLVVGLVSFPFYLEKRRIEHAKQGLAELHEYCDSLLILDNNRLLQLHPELPINEAFMMMDGILSTIIKGITETITLPSLINLDFADVRTVMERHKGLAALMSGEGSIYMPEDIIESTLTGKFINFNHQGAKGALIHLTGGPEMSLTLIDEIVKGLTKGMKEDATVIFGARVDPNLSKHIKVMAIMTGVDQKFSPCPIDPGGRRIRSKNIPGPKKLTPDRKQRKLPGMEDENGISWIK